MTLKLTLNDFEDQRSLSQNDLDNELVKCTKFEASISNSFQVMVY